MRFCPINLDPRSSFFLAALGLLVTATACRAGGASPGPPTKPPAVPTFEKLPHTPLPKGKFIAWCGDRERYLLATDGRYVDAYDGSTKISAPSPTQGPAQCDADGRYIVFVEDDAGRVRKFELETGKSEVLATTRVCVIGIFRSPTGTLSRSALSLSLSSVSQAPKKKLSSPSIEEGAFA